MVIKFSGLKILWGNTSYFSQRFFNKIKKNSFGLSNPLRNLSKRAIKMFNFFIVLNKKFIRILKKFKISLLFFVVFKRTMLFLIHTK